jgi:hypothetical protein
VRKRIALKTPITTREVCRRFGLPESTLRHVLRRPGAPRPQLHPSARLFLWTEDDVAALAAFMGRAAPAKSDAAPGLTSQPS